jgi:hypothetical protein
MAPLGRQSESLAPVPEPVEPSLALSGNDSGRRGVSSGAAPGARRASARRVTCSSDTAARQALTPAAPGPSGSRGRGQAIRTGGAAGGSRGPEESRGLPTADPFALTVCVASALPSRRRPPETPGMGDGAAVRAASRIAARGPSTTLRWILDAVRTGHPRPDTPTANERSAAPIRPRGPVAAHNALVPLLRSHAAGSPDQPAS